MENYLAKVLNESDEQYIVFKIAYFFLQKRINQEWKDVSIFNHERKSIEKISDWFPKELPKRVSLEEIRWKTLNQIFYTYYHFSMIKEFCMRFYPSITIEIYQEWLKILLSLSSFQELYKKDIEKMTEIYFHTHIEYKFVLPVKLQFELFQDILIDDSFMNLFFERPMMVRPRNLSMEFDMEYELENIQDTSSLISPLRTISPSFSTSFKNFEVYSKMYHSGHTPYHFWMRTSPFLGQNLCLSPTSFAN